MPRFDDFFRYEFESRLGYQLGLSYERSDGIVIGVKLDAVNFLPYSANYGGIESADYKGFSFQSSYALWKSGNATLEPHAGSGYAVMKYNRGAIRSRAFLFKVGSSFVWKSDEGYGLFLSLSWLAYYDRFGSRLNPSDTKRLEMLLISAGFFIWP